MMSFEEFKDYIKDNILEYLPKQYEDAKVTINQMVKNNDMVLDGVQILSEDSNIAPIIYVNEAYERYQDGMDVDEIVGKLADRFIDSHSVEKTFDIGFLSDFEQVKDRIVCRLVNQERNSQRLSGVPFTPMEDLAVTYHIMVSQDSDSIGSIMIDNHLQEKYGVETETLHETALENMRRLQPMVLRSLNDIMLDMMTPDFMRENMVSEEQAHEMLSDMIPPADMSPQVFCLTTSSKINGAVCIADPHIQEKVAEKLGGDFYVLPSSVHEVLLMKKDGSMTYEELQDMVQDVNQNIVSEDEILSDHVYQYDAKTHEFSRADRTPKMEQKLAAVQENKPEYHMGENEQTQEIEAPKHSSLKH